MLKYIIIIIFVILSRANTSSLDSIFLEYNFEEIEVIDDRFELDNQTKLFESTENVLQQKQSIELIRRANFASEPTIRGFSQGQISMTFDGMRLFPACVDRMDPVSSYIEIENLENLYLSESNYDLTNGGSIGGSINFSHKKPIQGEGLKLYTENHYGSVSNLFINRSRLNYSYGRFDILSSFSLRNSSDMMAGNSELLSNSGFYKHNAKFNIRYRDSDKITHDLEYIFDKSKDVGYPGLIMDTRNTDMHSISYNLKMIDELDNHNIKIYFNRIEHLMDDYDRSFEEIMTRDIMPGMYMPMFGNNSTFGLRYDSRLLTRENSFLKLSLENYYFSAFADMEMIAADPNNQFSNMYLYNLGDTYTFNSGFAATYYYQFTEKINSVFSGRFDFQNRDVTNSDAILMASSYWNSETTENNDFILNFSTLQELKLSELHSINISFAYSERAATHIENFAYYIYNISDNSIYMGNPNLNKEKAIQMQSSYRIKSDKSNLKLTGFGNYIIDYIAGTLDTSSGTIFGQNFRNFSNIGEAYIIGIESYFSHQLDEYFSLNLDLKYQYSNSIRFNESLPFTPPLSGNLTMIYNIESLRLIVNTRFAGSQNRFSETILKEDKTPAFAIINLSGAYVLSKTFNLKFGIENILDKYYHEHFSISNIPNPGRNFYLSLGMNIF